MASHRDALVTRKEIKEFAKRFVHTQNGMFITLSDFDPMVFKSVRNPHNYFITGKKRILLVDGRIFAGWLNGHNFGTRKIATYEINEIDYNVIDHLLDDYKRLAPQMFEDDVY
jgi:restriction endonuclease Mrr